MPRKPQLRTQETRSRILATARDLMSRTGADGITAEALASAAGVAKGTVFAHFTSMDGLMSYVLLDDIRSLIPADLSAVRAADTARFADPLERITSMMMDLVTIITSSQLSLRLFLENTGATNGKCAPEFIAILDQLDGLLHDYLEEWQGQPEVRPALRKDRSPRELVDALIAFMIHVAIQFRSCQIDDLEAARHKLKRHAEAYLLERTEPFPG
ncbi:TetR/AcrR family transcriptional regulator [Roseibium litorale]|uniref:TetR/AcrR family transcriptional regulator n=1 Tax=Roseibium litorale TaxID=2803841 RepID=A0ABR9CRN6_9HYPH|nr:TetR/AcrR family transcriptional regulator [Roseibium litorale]MBD8893509.1 TetR/AcrR family transcriptional regulator [Roseibium litorale]